MTFHKEGIHFLIIEDNQGDMVLIRDYIEEEFSNPVFYEASTLDEAKRHLTDGLKIDIILLDLMLPDGQGEELLNEVIPMAKSIPIIILTGYTDKEFSIKSLSYGVSDYLLKEDLNAPLLFKSVLYNIEHKKIQEKLSESEKKYKDLFHSSPLPKIVYDVETSNFLDANDAALRKYGYTREEFLQLKVPDVIFKTDQEKVTRELKLIKENNSFNEISLRHVKKSGEPIDVETQSNEIIFNGRKARLVLATDITEKLKAEKENVLAEQRFKALVQDGSELISILDTEGYFKFISPNIKNRYDLDPKDFIGTYAFDKLHYEDLDFFKQQFSQLKNHKRITTKPFRYIRFQNKWRWLEASVVDMTDNPAVNGIVLNARDVTERIENELKIKESNLRYEAIAKATSDAIYEFDSVSKKIYIAGSNYNKIFGFNFKDQQYLDLDFWVERLHPDEIAWVREKIATIKPNPSNLHHEIEYRFKREDGSYAHVLDRFDLIWENGRQIKKIGALQDITARKFQDTILSFEKDIYKLNAAPESNLDMVLHRIINNIERLIPEAICSIVELKNKKINHIIGTSLPQSYVDSLDQMNGEKSIFAQENIFISDILSHHLCSNFASVATAHDLQSCWSIPIKKTDGTIIASFVVYYRINKLPDKDQVSLLERVANLVGVVIESRRAGEDLKQAIDRYDIVAKATSDTIWDWKIQEDNFVWNKGIQGVFGYKKEDVGTTSKWWFDRIHPEDSLRVSVKLYNFLEKKVEKWQDEYRFKCADGSYKFVFDRGFLIKNNDGKPIRMIASMQDVTKQKEENQRLKLMETVITQAKDAVIITESDTSESALPKIIFANQAFSKMSGYKATEVIGNTPLLFNGENSDKKELEKLINAVKTEKATNIETISYKKNGDEYWVSFSMIPIFDKDGKLSHWISIQKDVTDQKIQEKEKEQLIRELTQNNKDLKQFSYITSHNLRAPLSNLTGLLNLIEDIPIENSDLQLILNGFTKSTHLLNETINDLVKVVIIKDNPSIQKEEVLFSEVFESVFNQLNYLINLHQPILKINLEKDSLSNINKAYLESIILNLLTNAIKYRNPSKKLKISISTKEKEDQTILTFEDNGIGIDIERNKDKIFGLYQRFHNYPDSKGLGLYLVKSQVETMGGTIDVQSEVDKGTKFTLTFKK
jgi:PAS domain S-box-containing protein